ncbi:MAG TPA: malto-oligosyltrehalose synthase [Chloroflexota bacterium]|nr:malto-oligosyltrehalose synthase [Chloroflexota bacterium]
MRRVPASTYRLQLRREFGFRDAAAIVPYLHRLGVDWLYASPYLKARAESTHGYDVSDHNQLNPALGEAADYEAMVAALRRRGMGQLLDIVPNHMGIGEPSNVWWWDLLENGRASLYADYFDVDWRPLSPLPEETRDRVLLPFLGDQYGRVLETGRLRVELREGLPALRCYDHPLPLAPESYALALGPVLERLDDEDPAAAELASILTAMRHLPGGPAKRHREVGVAKRRLVALLRHDPGIGAAVDRVIDKLNGRIGDPGSFDRLDQLLGAQHYRLAYWRVASEEINYRRFFDVNDLAAIRMENPAVFAATHRLVLRLVAEHEVMGLRLDHPDGLWDPAEYTARLRQAAGGLYLVAEKILAPDEPLPESWAVDGTVGYEVLNALTALFVDASRERRIGAVYRRFTGQATTFHEVVYQSKRLIMRSSLAGEGNVLARMLRRIASRNRLYRDFMLNDLRHAVREVIACFPVYRTYVREGDRRTGRRDRAYVERAIAEARRRNPTTDASYFAFLRDLLLLKVDDPEARSFVMKLQQVTGPVAAKGVEDTAFYAYNRLVALNEVGGEPDRFGVSVGRFHRLCAERARRQPGGLTPTSTHDTKRSEDVRARIAVLSELPGEWERSLTEWERLNRRKRRRVGGRSAPDRNEEYLLYQTLLGAWPIDAERAVEYMRKAAKEAKVNTSWISPNEEWDAALEAFVRAVLADEAFLAAFAPLQRRVAGYGLYNALGQTLLRLTVPGVPDVYQGQELWDYSLVDPDNRRPVDYRRRRRLLDALLARRPDPGELLASWCDGRIKLWLTHCGLTLRRERPGLFHEGAYLPLTAEGRRRGNVVAFARRRGDELAVVAAPRLVTRLTADPADPPLGPAVWEDTALPVPPGRYVDRLTGCPLAVGAEPLAVGELFRELPVALLVSASS